MRAVAASLSVALFLLLAVGPAAAQETAEPDPSVTTCVLITSAVELAGLDAMALGQLLIEGEATLEVLDPAACDPLAGADPTARPTTEPPPTPTPTPELTAEPQAAAYVEFVAHGAGAAIELARLAQRNEDAIGLAGLDRAAVELKRWAKRQIRWLDRHPPEPCYARVHARWRAGVVEVRDGAKAVRKAVRTLRPEPMRRAVRQLSAGSAKLTGVDLGRVTPACIAE